MTIDEAIKILDGLFAKPEISEDDEPLFVECLTLLANDKENELCGEAQYYLGDYYNGNRRADLAISYWERSAENGFEAAYAGLGDIYFFGEIGEFDYEKAFYYYSKGAEKDNRYCKYMVADMYKDGLFVQQNYEKYKLLIEELYNDNKDDENSSILPDIILRLARIRAKEKDIDNAINLYSDAINKYINVVVKRKYLAYISRILEANDELHQLRRFDVDELNIFNISYLMKSPIRIIFMYEDDSYEIETVNEEDGIVVHFGNKWYRSVEEFYKNAKIVNDSITTLAYELYGFEVIK